MNTIKLSTLRSRADRKRARISAKGGVYTVFDNRNDSEIGKADTLVELEDLIAWIDRV